MPASFPSTRIWTTTTKLCADVHIHNPHTGNMVSCRSLELTGHSAQLSSGVDPVRNIGQMRTPSGCLYMHTWTHTHTCTAAHTHTNINTLHICMREDMEKNTSVETTGENHTGNTSLWALKWTNQRRKWQVTTGTELNFESFGAETEQSAEWGGGPHNGGKALPDVHLTGP